jgi:hypothetical protein
MRDAVNEYMAAVDQDKEDGLDPDTARLWKEQVQEIVASGKCVKYGVCSVLTSLSRGVNSPLPVFV